MSSCRGCGSRSNRSWMRTPVRSRTTRRPPRGRSDRKTARAHVILDFVKQQCHLSSPLLLAVLLAAGAVSLWRRPSSALARRYVLGLALGYWFVATRVGAVVLLSVLSYGVRPIATRQEAASADTVVLLSGGVYTASVGDEVGGAPTASSLLRALEAARVVKLIDARRGDAAGGDAVRDPPASEG